MSLAVERASERTAFRVFWNGWWLLSWMFNGSESDSIRVCSNTQGSSWVIQVTKAFLSIQSDRASSPYGVNVIRRPLPTLRSCISRSDFSKHPSESRSVEPYALPWKWWRTRSFKRRGLGLPDLVGDFGLMPTYSKVNPSRSKQSSIGIIDGGFWKNHA